MPKMLQKSSEGIGRVLGAAIVALGCFVLLLLLGGLSRLWYEIWNLGFTMFGLLS